MPILHSRDGMPISLNVYQSERANGDPLQPGGNHTLRLLAAASDRRGAKALLDGIETLLLESLERVKMEPAGALEYDFPELRQLPADMRAEADALVREVVRAGGRILIARAWLNVKVPDCACP
jgi:hypothetical protein